MNLKPITPASTTSLLCANTFHEGSTRWFEARTGFADLDGTPFRAYYCETCARKLSRPASLEAINQEQQP